MGCFSTNCCCEIISENDINRNKIEVNPNEESKIDSNKYKQILDFANSQKDFIVIALNKNNEYRISHNVDKLISDEDLIKRAFILSYQKLIEGKYSNDYLNDEKNKKLGMISLESNEKLDPDELMSKWYEDLIEYNPKEPDEYKGLSSTQIIWKDSKKFGIGYYYVPFIQDKNDVGNGNIITKQKKYCYIALYYPAGNQYENKMKEIEKIENKKNKNKKPKKEEKNKPKIH